MELKLKARARSETGKGAARKLRALGEIPAVMYGHNMEPRPLAVRREDLQDAIHGSAGLNVLLDLQVVDGKNKANHLVMIKELQRHPFKERLLHVDFLKVARDEKVTMKVPVAVSGEEDSVGLRAGGTLQHNVWEIEVQCLPSQVPDHVKAEVSEVAIGEHITVGQLKVPEGVTVLTDPEDVVLTILAPRLAAAGEEAAEEEAAKEEAAPAEQIPGAAPTEAGEEE